MKRIIPILLVSLLLCIFSIAANSANLTDADAPTIGCPFVTPNVVSGHKIPWLDQCNEWKGPFHYFTNTDPTVYPAKMVLTGSGLTPGDVVGIRLFFNGTNHDYTKTVVGGDTFNSVNLALKNLVMADPAVTNAGITFGFQTIIPEATLWVNAPWNTMPVVSDLTTSATAHYTITQSNGKLDSGTAITFTHTVNGRLPKNRDFIASLNFQGDTDDNGTPVAIGAQYAQILTGIHNPSHSAPGGFIQLLTGADYFEINSTGLIHNGNLLSAGTQVLTVGDCTIGIRGATNAGTPNYTARSCKYTKIGRQVTVHAFILLGSPAWTSTPTGYAMITGLPFVIRDIVPSANIGFWGNLTLSSGNTMPAIAGSNINLSTLDVTQSGSGLGASAVPVSGVNNGFGLRFTITYLTD